MVQMVALTNRNLRRVCSSLEKTENMSISAPTMGIKYPGMNDELTAANFGNVSDIATSSDIALGIVNMVAETIATTAIFAARSHSVKEIVLTGNLTTMPHVRRVFEGLESTFGVKFIIPENSQFGTVIGAALHAFDEGK